MIYNAKKNKRKIRVGQILLNLFLLLLVFVALYPIYVMVISSFKEQLDIFMNPFALPSPFKFENYSQAWTKARMGTYFFNSVVISGTTVISILAVASMAAYVFSRFKFKGKQLLYLCLLAGMLLPGRLALVPQFILVRDLKLMDTQLSLILIYVAGAMPFSIFMLANFFDKIPMQIEESAIIDGASVWRRYASISLPLARPALATVAVFNLNSVWNDFFLPLILMRTPAKMTLPVGLTVFFGEFTVQWNLLFAALVIASTPLIVLFLLMTKQFISGLTAGALKG